MLLQLLQPPLRPPLPLLPLLLPLSMQPAPTATVVVQRCCHCCQSPCSCLPCAAAAASPHVAAASVLLVPTAYCSCCMRDAGACAACSCCSQSYAYSCTEQAYGSGFPICIIKRECLLIPILDAHRGSGFCTRAYGCAATLRGFYRWWWG